MRKRIGAVLLTVCLLLGLLPTTVLADDTSGRTYEEFLSMLNGGGNQILLTIGPNFVWPTEPIELTINKDITFQRLSGDTVSWTIPSNVTLIFENGCSIRNTASTDYFERPVITINGTIKGYSGFVRGCNVVLGSSGSLDLNEPYVGVPPYVYIGAGEVWTIQEGAVLTAGARLDGTLTGAGTVAGTIDVQGGYNGTDSNATISGSLTLTGAVNIGLRSWGGVASETYSDTLTVPSGSHVFFQPAQRYMGITIANGCRLVLNGELTVGSSNNETTARISGIGLEDGAAVEIAESGVLSMYSPYELTDDRSFNDGDSVEPPSQLFIAGSGTIKFYDSGEYLNWYRIFGHALDAMDQYPDLLDGYVSDDVTIWRSWKVDCDHQWGQWVTEEEVTCGKDGWKTHTCSVCGITEGEPIPATGNHTSDGNTDCTKETKCTVCGQVLKAAGEHVWNDGTETKHPTCTESGEKTVTCTNCNATDILPIPALGHDLTYTANGSTITENCQREDCDHTATATLSAADGVYTGQAVENGKVVYSEGWLGGDLTITYSDNINAGTAAASITVDEISANVTFQIARAEHTMSLANLSQTSGNVSAVTCTVSPADSTAKVTVEYQVDGEWTDQFPTAVGSYPVRARVAESDNLVLADVGTYTTGTLIISQRSSGGGSTGSSSSSGNKTEVEKNPDGSTTTTVTKPNGTVTETTKYPDGSQAVVETKKDGTVTTTTTDKTGNETEVVENTDGTTRTTITNEDGSSSVTKTDKDGNVEAQVKLPTDVVEDAVQKGWAVALPMPSVSASSNRDEAPTVTVDLSRNTTAKVEIPVEDVTPGTVAVLVKADGTEEVIKTSLTTGGGVTVTLSDGDTVKIVDNSRDFADVPDAHWASEAVDFAASRELFAGTSDTTFAPEVAMNRAMIVTVLARFEGVDTYDGDSWYEAGQQWAVENGISDGTNLDQNLTREQLITMLWRYAGSPVIEVGLGAYPDRDSVSGWAIKAMAWAVNAGIITGADGGTLAPQGVASRAQVAAILMRFVETTV